MDQQLCEIQLASYAYTDKDIGKAYLFLFNFIYKFRISMEIIRSSSIEARSQLIIA